MEKVNNEMPTMGNPATPKAKKKPRAGWLYWVVFLLLVVFGVGVLFGPELDLISVESVRCEVVSAEPRSSSGGLRGSASTASVLIQTSDCGRLAITEGVTFDGRQELAASFQVGAEYEFDIGWLSRVIMNDVLHQIQSVQGYRLV
ncbi:hypothetical protein [Cryobacterium sp. TMB1-7]|uniref:hypothetical protein n=1 Tax=Cryobacterium sp. TMB1-7 TaxID=2555866 RepID=UPI00106D4E1A|nr:hypothetical protein [Cryobacterium sp. TMB1-7]TFC59635.1 hypothetical protein E3O60_08885 [Cryobacterium sp. TMB1-7]